MTEYGNAQRLFDTHGERLQFCFDVERWLHWTGYSWAWDTGSQVRSMAARLPRTIYPEGNEHVADALHFAKWARESQKQRTVNAAVSMLENCRLLAAIHRKEDWALRILGFCAEAGVVGRPTNA